MNGEGKVLDVDGISQAWIDAGRPGEFKTFFLLYRGLTALKSDGRCVELWIRRQGLTRTAFWREPGSGEWQWIGLEAALSAARNGVITVGSLVDANVVVFKDES